MKICTVNIDEKDLPEELKILLDMGKDGNGEEVFGYLMDDGISIESTRETVTETRTVRVGESLGQVVTSGYGTKGGHLQDIQ